ncbi:MAG: LysR family transcriptional regulator [Deltaproteobacteria bacterium]|jgi:DNA-binding transcriptional LysR family regulator|nr:LysR family transcriptional regulator [Deltaproteobacteria bacterium]
MELRVLRYFLAVAQAESISGAAQHLHVTQPTLSRQLMDLEAELGAKLLIRGRKVTLTEKGALLRKRAQEIIELTDKASAEFLAPDEALGGEIHIGAGETDAMRLIAKAAVAFRRRYPLVRYRLHSGNAEDISEKLDKGLLDFGLMIAPPNLRKYDSIRLPATDTWGLLMRKDSPLAKLASIRPEDIWDAPLIGSHQRMVSGELSKWIGRDYGRLNVVATYNLIFNAALMVEEGLGYALCLDKLVSAAGSQTMCFRPLEPPLESAISFVWKKDQVFSKSAESFLLSLAERWGVQQAEPNG